MPIPDRLAALADCTDAPAPCLTRLAWSPAMQAAQSLVRQWMEEAGLTVREDAVGNLCGRREGTVPGQRTLLLGSHLDSVRDAGRFDGPLGILVAIEAVAALNPLPFPVEVIAFQDEEGARFQTTYLGSRALAGTLIDADLDRTDADGITVADAMAAAGGNPDALAACQRQPDDLLGYVEVHIEQGPVLETGGLPVGVVTGISGQTRVALTLTGHAGHAGTVPMELRQDALCAAAEVVSTAESLARKTRGLVVTCGQLTVTPGASNVIPGQVDLTLDIRHADDEARSDAAGHLRVAALTASESRGVLTEWRVIQETAAVACDPTLTEALAASVAAAGIPVRHLPSGAGHDAAALARLCPVAMLFVRCRGGISHHPDEYAAPEDIAVALDVLTRFCTSISERYG